MNHEVPFDSIESAQEFLALFAEAVLETRGKIQVFVQRGAPSNGSRRLEALHIIASLLDKLEIEVKESRRILNDLRSLRRLLFQERANSTMMAARPKSIKTAEATSAVVRVNNTYITVKRRALSVSRAADAPNRPIPWYVSTGTRSRFEGTETLKAAS